MKISIIAIIFLTMTAAILTGCGDRVETDPIVLIPIFLDAREACEGGYNETYENIPRSLACENYNQLSACLTGNKDECPPKG
jgi:hypothetical protein